MDDVRIRPAIVADAERLAAVSRSAYRENRELGFPTKAESATESEVSTWIREHRVYVVTNDGDVVAGVRLEETEPDSVKLSRLAVHDDWKGQGVGSRLLDHVEDAMCAAGYETIWLTTPPEHPFLPDLYRERGYEETGPYVLDYREYDEVVMEKRLQ